jgi:Flp pilus assembly pilin Flp
MSVVTRFVITLDSKTSEFCPQNLKINGGYVTRVLTGYVTRVLIGYVTRVLNGYVTRVLTGYVTRVLIGYVTRVLTGCSSYRRYNTQSGRQ